MIYLVLFAAIGIGGIVETVKGDGSPSWVKKLPVGDHYVYFRGEGSDVDLERAKLKARADAFRKAVIWSGKGHTSGLDESFSLSTSAGEELSTESEIKFDPGTLPKAEWVDDYNKVTVAVSNFYTTRKGWVAPDSTIVDNHYYALLRYPKPGPNLLVAIGHSITGRTSAVIHSALYPGWGQARQGRSGEAKFFGILGTLSGITAGGLYVLESAVVVDPADPQTKEAKDWLHKYRRGATYAFAGIYGANLVDALIFGRASRDYNPRGISMNLGPDGRGLGVQWQLALR